MKTFLQELTQVYADKSNILQSSQSYYEGEQCYQKIWRTTVNSIELSKQATELELIREQYAQILGLAIFDALQSSYHEAQYHIEGFDTRSAKDRIQLLTESVTEFFEMYFDDKLLKVIKEQIPQEDYTFERLMELFLGEVIQRHVNYNSLEKLRILLNQYILSEDGAEYPIQYGYLMFFVLALPFLECGWKQIVAITLSQLALAEFKAKNEQRTWMVGIDNQATCVVDGDGMLRVIRKSLKDTQNMDAYYQAVLEQLAAS